ncbi:Hypothetical protein PHPALM_4140 [Phytophthora palmivora]|uniref:Uncharacterized protein n=1 Tax=Phytophthora palmivora TaxID=4796 RepID=A0A2P4YKR5_9STRA|nr:Hypothetical protein PHPALM_4140 [Phytophthora palmivora]
MEALNVRPYAAEHGFVIERYEVVISNFNEHWDTELWVEEESTEHKRLLQDIVGELKDVEAKEKKKAGLHAKSNRLGSDGERLREQALRRRNQRGTSVQSGKVPSDSSDADETSELSSDIASSTRSSGYQAGGGLTTAHVNAETVEFIAKQSKRHEDEYQLLRDDLSFKQTKAKLEEACWKEEFEFRKREAEANTKKWSEEVDIRRSDMEMGREKLELRKYQLNLPPIPNPSTQANV